MKQIQATVNHVHTTHQLITPFFGSHTEEQNLIGSQAFHALACNNFLYACANENKELDKKDHYKRIWFALLSWPGHLYRKIECAIKLYPYFKAEQREITGIPFWDEEFSTWRTDIAIPVDRASSQYLLYLEYNASVLGKDLLIRNIKPAYDELYINAFQRVYFHSRFYSLIHQHLVALSILIIPIIVAVLATASMFIK